MRRPKGQRLSLCCNGHTRQRFASALRGGRGRGGRRAACSTPRWQRQPSLGCHGPLLFVRIREGKSPLTLGQDETEKIVAHLRQKCKRPDSKTAPALSEVGAKAVLLYASGKGKKKKKENARASNPCGWGRPSESPLFSLKDGDAASGGKQKALTDFALSAPLLSTASV